MLPVIFTISTDTRILPVKLNTSKPLLGWINAGPSGVGYLLKFENLNHREAKTVGRALRTYAILSFHAVAEITTRPWAAGTKAGSTGI